MKVSLMDEDCATFAPNHLIGGTSGSSSTVQSIQYGVTTLTVPVQGRIEKRGSSGGSRGIIQHIVAVLFFLAIHCGTYGVHGSSFLEQDLDNEMAHPIKGVQNHLIDIKSNEMFIKDSEKITYKNRNKKDGFGNEQMLDLLMNEEDVSLDNTRSEPILESSSVTVAFAEKDTREEMKSDKALETSAPSIDDGGENDQQIDELVNAPDDLDIEETPDKSVTNLRATAKDVKSMSTSHSGPSLLDDGGILKVTHYEGNNALARNLSYTVTPSAAPTTPPPSVSPSCDKTEEPSILPSVAPPCTEDPESRFLLRVNGKNHPEKKKCSWLEGMKLNGKENQVKSICEKKIYLGKTGPARVVCPITCNTCSTASPSSFVQSSSQPTTQPTTLPTTLPTTPPTSIDLGPIGSKVIIVPVGDQSLCAQLFTWAWRNYTEFIGLAKCDDIASQYFVVTEDDGDDESSVIKYMINTCGRSTCVEGIEGVCNQEDRCNALESVDISSAKKAVRCCSDNFITGWTKHESCEVWSATNALGCHEDKTWFEAKEICEIRGGRLCTSEEVLADCTAGTGCGFDAKLVWTSSAGNILSSSEPSESPTCKEKVLFDVGKIKGQAFFDDHMDKWEEENPWIGEEGWVRTGSWRSDANTSYAQFSKAVQCPSPQPSHPPSMLSSAMPSSDNYSLVKSVSGGTCMTGKREIVTVDECDTQRDNNVWAFRGNRHGVVMLTKDGDFLSPYKCKLVQKTRLVALPQMHEENTTCNDTPKWKIIRVDKEKGERCDIVDEARPECLRNLQCGRRTASIEDGDIYVCCNTQSYPSSDSPKYCIDMPNGSKCLTNDQCLSRNCVKPNAGNGDDSMVRGVCTPGIYVPLAEDSQIISISSLQDSTLCLQVSSEGYDSPAHLAKCDGHRHQLWKAKVWWESEHDFIGRSHIHRYDNETSCLWGQNRTVWVSPCENSKHGTLTKWAVHETNGRIIADLEDENKPYLPYLSTNDCSAANGTEVGLDHTLFQDLSECELTQRWNIRLIKEKGERCTINDPAQPECLDNLQCGRRTASTDDENFYICCGTMTFPNIDSPKYCIDLLDGSECFANEQCASRHCVKSDPNDTKGKCGEVFNPMGPRDSVITISPMDDLSMCLESADNQTHLSKCSYNTTQQWVVTNSSLTDDFYLMSASGTNQCFTGDSDAQDPVAIQTCDFTDINQHWFYEKTSGRIINNALVNVTDRKYLKTHKCGTESDTKVETTRTRVSDNGPCEFTQRWNVFQLREAGQICILNNRTKSPLGRAQCRDSLRCGRKTASLLDKNEYICCNAAIYENATDYCTDMSLGSQCWVDEQCSSKFCAGAGNHRTTNMTLRGICSEAPSSKPSHRPSLSSEPSPAPSLAASISTMPSTSPSSLKPVAPNSTVLTISPRKDPTLCLEINERKSMDAKLQKCNGNDNQVWVVETNQNGDEATLRSQADRSRCLFGGTAVGKGACNSTRSDMQWTYNVASGTLITRYNGTMLYLSTEACNTPRQRILLAMNNTHNVDDDQECSLTQRWNINSRVFVKTGNDYSIGAYSVGSYDDGLVEQDFGGGSYDIVGDHTIKMFGNAWKSFVLSEPYPVTKDTRLFVNFTKYQEAEGYAICVDQGLDRSYRSLHPAKCFMIGGSQFDIWENIHKYSIAQGKRAKQSSTFEKFVSDASKAVDGIIAPNWVLDSAINSVSRTKSEIHPWWEVHLGETFDISEVILYDCIDTSTEHFCGKLDHLNVTVYDGQTEVANQIHDVGNEKSFVYVRFNDTVTKGDRVRVTLNGNSTKRALSLAEVLVTGLPSNKLSGSPMNIDVSIGHLSFSKNNALVNYISLIQDNDKEPLIGESTFSDIKLYEDTEERSANKVDENCVLPKNINITGPVSCRCRDGFFPFHIERDDGFGIPKQIIDGPDNKCVPVMESKISVEVANDRFTFNIALDDAGRDNLLNLTRIDGGERVAMKDLKDNVATTNAGAHLVINRLKSGKKYVTSVIAPRFQTPTNNFHCFSDYNAIGSNAAGSVTGFVFKESTDSSISSGDANSIIQAISGDIGGTEDSFYFAHVVISNENFEVLVQIEDRFDEIKGRDDNNSTFGLMVRESSDPGSRHFSVYVTPSFIGTQYRPTPGDSTRRTQYSAVTPDSSLWLKIKRKGSTFTAITKKSKDGEEYEIGSFTFDNFQQRAEVGVALSSFVPKQKVTGKFSNFELQVFPKEKDTTTIQVKTYVETDSKYVAYQTDGSYEQTFDPACYNTVGHGCSTEISTSGDWVKIIHGAEPGWWYTITDGVGELMSQQGRNADDKKYAPPFPACVSWGDIDECSVKQQYRLIKPPYRNVAPEGYARQSSTNGDDYKASNAIDGDPSKGVVSLTSKGANPWWEVKLNSTHYIREIYVYSSSEKGDPNLKGFTLTISLEGKEVFRSEPPNYRQDEYLYMYKIPANVRGDVVRIARDSNSVDACLRMAEVQVIGVAEDDFEQLQCLGVDKTETPITLPLVTTCSCDNGLDDTTGTPKDLIVFQENGHVMFNFTDNSMCEDAFSFTRLDSDIDFILHFTKKSISFTPDYHFTGHSACYEKVRPKTLSSDDLSSSNLLVGKIYTYCVRAVRSSGYMDEPYVHAAFSRDHLSSENACAKHRIRWEGSISGRVTTIPKFGKLPIEGVKVAWELASGSTKLECDECSGSTLSNEDGVFRIVINVDDSKLYGKQNEKGVPVRIRYSKTSGEGNHTVTHKFSYNDGAIEYDDLKGQIEYLHHLEFDKPLKIYDESEVPFKGKIYIADTSTDAGFVGCPVEKAKVCLMYHDTTSTDMQKNLVCVETDNTGQYEAPVVIGSVVHNIRVDYNNHTFVKAFDEGLPWDEVSGIRIEAPKDGGVPYSGYDFKDVTKKELTVEVVGGMCNHTLGVSTISWKIIGCDWEHPGVTQESYTQKYFAPAHLIEVRVRQVKNDEFVPSTLLDPVNNFFSKERRTIDLTVEHYDSNDRKTTNQGQATDSTADAIKKKSKEKMNKRNALQDLVRFQYDGAIIIDFRMTSGDLRDKKKCGDSKIDEVYLETKGANTTFHIVEYMEPYFITVGVKFEIVPGYITCDIVGDEYHVAITNKVGVDENDGFEEFIEHLGEKQSKALLYCSEGCALPIIHDVDSQGRLSNARVETAFFAGRPEIFYPYAKKIFVMVGNTQHVANVFVEGLYDKGTGAAMALPTHEPLMIIRDPPGGGSYAKYNNVVTRMKAVNTEATTSMKAKVQLSTGVGFKEGSSACEGEAMVVVAILCETVAGAQEISTLYGSEELGGPLHHFRRSESNDFTTTWSFTTSTDPSRAGSESDVFVVPNMNVKYREVDIVQWEEGEEKCGVKLDDGKLPETIVFELDGNGNEPAISFYTRWHVNEVKIPEIENALHIVGEKLKKMENNEKVCCAQPVDGICEEGMRVCNLEEKKAQNKLEEDLKEALAGWQRNVNMKPTTSSIRDWYNEAPEAIGDNPLSLDSHNYTYAYHLDPKSTRMPPLTTGLPPQSYKAVQKDLLKIDDQLPALVPEQLAKTAKRLNTTLERKANIYTNLIQFAGGGTLYELSLTKQWTKETAGLSCWYNCPVTSNTNSGFKTTGKTNLFGPEFNIKSDVSLQIQYEHISKQQEKDGTSTSISVGLRDPDYGDEFAVELDFDKRYGTFFFETISGRSRCPHEQNTLANDDPALVALSQPPSFVYPNDAMVFDVELRNNGAGLSSTYMFSAYQGESNLQISVDGSSLTEGGMTYTMAQGDVKRKQVVVRRGPEQFKSEMITLALKPTCPDPTKKKTLDLYNKIETAGSTTNRFIEFVEFCPEVRWASDLMNDRGFLINYDSYYGEDGKDKDGLEVTIYNPDAINGNFSDHRIDNGGRIKNVFFQYRKIGDVDFNPGLRANDKKVMDFAADYASESPYGYSSMMWDIPQQDGIYEVLAIVLCNDLGGPPDLMESREHVLTGIIDRRQPEVYGEPLPLKQDVIFGEEVTVVFTKPLHCDLPLPFAIDIEFSKGVEQTVKFSSTNNDLHVICEGRKIGFQFKYDDEGSLEELIGKEFDVTITDIEDANGNSLKDDGTVTFNKTLANIDLGFASMKFRYQLNNMPCTNKNITALIDEAAAEIASIAGMSNAARIRVSEMECLEGANKAISTVYIGPPSRRRGLRHAAGTETDNDHSVNILSKIRDAMASETSHSRMDERKLDTATISRLFQVDAVEIIPCDSDIEKFKTPTENIGREEDLLRFASMRHDDSNNYDGNIADLVVRVKEELSGVKEELSNRLQVQHKEEMKNEVDLMQKFEEVQKQLKGKEENDLKNKADLVQKFKEMQKQLEVKEEEVWKRQFEEMQEMMKKSAFRENGLSEKNEVRELIVGAILITVGCMCVLFAVYDRLRR